MGRVDILVEQEAGERRANTLAVKPFVPGKKFEGRLRLSACQQCREQVAWVLGGRGVKAPCIDPAPAADGPLTLEDEYGHPRAVAYDETRHAGWGRCRKHECNRGDGR